LVLNVLFANPKYTFEASIRLLMTLVALAKLSKRKLLYV
jgi:hypothetical protein